MRNKVTSLLFAAILLVSLAACGDSPQHTQTDVDPPVSDSSAIPGNPPAAGVDASSSPALGSLPQLMYQPPARKSLEELEEVPVEEKVLVDEDGIKITSKTFEHPLYMPEFTVSVENGSDMAATVAAVFCSINDIVFLPYGTCLLDAGETAELKIGFGPSFCNPFRWMGPIREIEVAFTVTSRSQVDDYGDYSVTSHGPFDDDYSFTSDIVSVRTTAEPGDVQEHYDEGYVLYEAGGIKIVYLGVDYYTPLDDRVFMALYVENFGETSVGIYLPEVTINGIEIKGNDIGASTGAFLPAGKQAYLSTGYNATQAVYSNPEPIGYDMDTVEFTLFIYENNPGDYEYDSGYFSGGNPLVDGEKLLLTFA